MTPADIEASGSEDWESGKQAEQGWMKGLAGNAHMAIGAITLERKIGAGWQAVPADLGGWIASLRQSP